MRSCEDCLACFGVIDELSEDRVGDAALEAAHRLKRSLSFGALAPAVGLTVGGRAQLADGGDVDDVADPAVAGAGEPEAVLLWVAGAPLASRHEGG